MSLIEIRRRPILEEATVVTLSTVVRDRAKIALLFPAQSQKRIMEIWKTGCKCVP
eukprot:m.207818 g.207818  ORF g.207818 m.207818 type:complete len:55 (-) comp15031_c3_seq1:130-294(-)